MPGADELSVSIRKKLLSTPIQLCSLTQKMPTLLRYHVFQWLNASGHYSLDRSYKRLLKLKHGRLLDRLHRMHFPSNELIADILVQSGAFFYFQDSQSENLGTEKDCICMTYDALQQVDNARLGDMLKLLQQFMEMYAELCPSQSKQKRLVLVFYLLVVGKTVRQKAEDYPKIISACQADKEFSKLPADIFAISHYLQSHDLL